MLDQAFESLKKFDFGTPLSEVQAIEDAVVASHADAGVRKDLEQLVASDKSFEEMSRYIADRGVKYQIVEAVRPAEQLPLEVLPKLAELKDKETGLIENQGIYSLVHVRASKRAPITEATAKPAIEAYLTGVKRQRVVADEVKRMREGVKVEYLGMFAAAPAAATPVATAKQ